MRHRVGRCHPRPPCTPTGTAAAQRASRYGHGLFEPVVYAEAAVDGRIRLPGSCGGHLLQLAHGTQDRAKRSGNDQILDCYSPLPTELASHAS
jgi:hypothetical protein